jgi:hypothetical protein
MLTARGAHNGTRHTRYGAQYPGSTAHMRRDREKEYTLSWLGRTTVSKPFDETDVVTIRLPYYRGRMCDGMGWDEGLRRLRARVSWGAGMAGCRMRARVRVMRAYSLPPGM